MSISCEKPKWKILYLYLSHFAVQKELIQHCKAAILQSKTFLFIEVSNTRNKFNKLNKHKLESRLPGEISITSDMQMTPPLWQKVRKN